MQMKYFFLRGIASLGLLAGVVSAVDAYAGVPEETGEPVQAQPELPREPLSILSADGKKHSFSVEMAKTPRQQQVGEMFRTNLPEDRGMLFVWAYPQQSDMWMENTLIPLDIVFIGADHKIQAIAENAVPRSLAHISSHGPVVATLELAGGVTQKLGISVGDTVETTSLPKPPSKP
jgi:uncharacterized membrane protein (UPF0127 family)